MGIGMKSSKKVRKFVFYIRVGGDFLNPSVSCDMLHEVKSYTLIDEKYAGKNPVEVFEKLFKVLGNEGKAEIACGIGRDVFENDINVMNSMSIRAKANGGVTKGPYLVSVPYDVVLDFDDIDNILKSKSNDELKTFLESAKF